MILFMIFLAQFSTKDKKILIMQHIYIYLYSALEENTQQIIGTLQIRSDERAFLMFLVSPSISAAVFFVSHPFKRYITLQW